MENQEQLARKWAEKYLKWNAREDEPELHAVAELVLEHTNPPTMADVEWDYAAHYLAGATHSIAGEVVMLDEIDEDTILTSSLSEPAETIGRSTWNLTPNGKRYKLAEATASQDENVGPEQAEHPKTLRTAEDYDGAPVGTIAAAQSLGAWTKYAPDGWCLSGSPLTAGSKKMANDARDVLRWGVA